MKRFHLLKASAAIIAAVIVFSSLCPAYSSLVRADGEVVPDSQEEQDGEQEEGEETSEGQELTEGEEDLSPGETTDEEEPGEQPSSDEEAEGTTEESTDEPTEIPSEEAPTETPDQTPTEAETEAEPGFVPETTGVGGFVNRMYTVVLQRNPEEGGYYNWIDALTSGRNTGAEAAEGFLFSNEFISKNVSNGDYVKILYRLFFNREPDQAGYDSWVALLNNGTCDRRAILAGFIDSVEWANTCVSYGIVSGGNGIPTVEVEVSEGIRTFVTSLYNECLGRQPDPDGFNDWCQRLALGRISGKEAAYGFFFSDEFLSIVSTSYPGDIIEKFYIVFLNREPDRPGYFGWLGRLYDDDGSISMLFDGFADSSEFRAKCLTYHINPGNHVDVPPQVGRLELFLRDFSDDISPEVTAMLQDHQSTGPRSSYPLCARCGGQMGTINISAADQAILQRFADEHFRPGWTDLQKLEYTALWIRTNVHYAYGGSGWAQIAGRSYTDAVFNARMGQCIQYNGGLLAMMSYLGYDVRMVEGHIGGAHHFWGEMEYNGVTYTIDSGCIEDNNLCFMVSTDRTGDYYTP